MLDFTVWRATPAGVIWHEPTTRYHARLAHLPSAQLDSISFRWQLQPHLQNALDVLVTTYVEREIIVPQPLFEHRHMFALLSTVYSWSGPSFDGMLCSPSAIELLDLSDPLVTALCTALNAWSVRLAKVRRDLAQPYAPALTA